MYETLAGADVALLDTSLRARSDITPLGLYVVGRGGESVIRYIRSGAQGFYLLTDASLESPALWEKLEIPPSQFPTSIKARVRWVGRERDRDLALNQRGRFL